MVIISAPINIATADPKARRCQHHRREPVAFNQKRRRISAMAAASLSAFPLLTCLRIKRCQLWAERTLIPATAAAVSWPFPSISFCLNSKTCRSVIKPAPPVPDAG